MGITQRFKNMDAYFKTSIGEKIIINDLDYISQDDDDIINRAIMTIYNNTDIMSTVPTCDCGSLKGRYNLGIVCDNCGTQCTEIHDRVDPILWLRILRDDIPFLNPGFWLVLRNLIDRQTDWLRWLSDPKYNPGAVNIPGTVLGIRELLTTRSYKELITKLPDILNFLADDPKFKDPDKQNNIQILKRIYQEEFNSLYSTYLPIINKRLFVMENTNKGRFVNFSSSEIIDISKLWIKISNDYKSLDYVKSTYDKAAAMTGTIISKLADLAISNDEKYLFQKEGIFRKHAYGARSHFTFRNVIVSRSGRHQMDEIEMPWGSALTVFRPHLINRIVRDGYTYRQASRMIFDSVNKFNPYLYKILNTLIAESKYKGIPVMVLRNPALFQSSTLLLYITSINPNPKAKVVAISQLLVDLMNGDYYHLLRCMVLTILAVITYLFYYIKLRWVM